MELLIAAVEKAAVLVTLMFVLGRTGFLARLERRPGRYDPLLAFGLFSLMALTETWLAAREQFLLDAHFIATCTAGLLAGPRVGVGVGAVSGGASLAVGSASAGAYLVPSLAGGLIAGLIRRRWPAAALRPSVGFALGFLMCLAWYLLAPLLGFALLLSMPQEFVRGTVNGAGVALLLLVADQMREMDRQARAAAMAEVRALQARMNPHFLFNSLNTLAALAESDPRAIPRATARLARFMRAALEQSDRPLVPLREELETVSAYLEIEKLRFGERLRVEEEIDAAVLDAPVPPFLLQPLVENAVRHGVRARAQRPGEVGQVRIEAGPDRDRLMLAVIDNGPGIPDARRRELLQGLPEDTHALALLRRRLHNLYDWDFEFSLKHAPGGGTVARLFLPRRGEPTTGPLSEETP